MFKFVKTILFIIASLWFPTANAQVTVSASIDSSTIVMGQQTVVHFHMSQPQNLPVQLPVLSDMLTKNVHIIEVVGDTIADGATITINDDIVITVFEPGDYVIPAFVCRLDDKEFKSKDLNLKVRDYPEMFEEGNIPSDIKMIQNPPYSKIIWVILFSAIAVLAAFGVWAFFYWKKHMSDPMPYVRNSAVADSEQPEQTALELIRKLGTDKPWAADGNEKFFFTQLTDVLRQYLFRRYSVNALEMTSSELVAALKQTDMPAHLREMLREICFTGDMTKFAKHHPSDEECEGCVQKAEKIVLDTMQTDDNTTDTTTHPDKD